MQMNVATAYRDSKIMTASPAELTLMLYDGAIKFCNIAIMAIEKNEIEKAHQNIVKAENIIMELRVTLNPKYPVAKDFDVIYEYIYRRLMESNFSKDKDILEEALGFIRDMRETWKDVMKSA